MPAAQPSLAVGERQSCGHGIWVGRMDSAAGAPAALAMWLRGRGSCRSHVRIEWVGRVSTGEERTSREGDTRMPDHVYKIIELVGSSSSSVEDAIQGAVGRASETITNLDWLEVKEIRGSIQGG